MNSLSHHMNRLLQHKLFITVILGLMLLVPVIATAQEATEEPQADTVVTEEVVEQPAQVEEPIAPTEEATVEEAEVVPDPPELPPEPVIEENTVEETVVNVEATEEVLVETTEEPTIEVVETEEATVETETTTVEEPVVEEIPVDITSIDDDFEIWTGENWSVTDWSIAQIDDSLALFSNLANATAQVISVDWTNYSIDVDAKVEAGNTLTFNFDSYSFLLASDGRNRLSQGGEVVATSPTTESSQDTPTWHHISIAKSGTGLTVTVDGIAQYTVATTNSPLGIFAFVATGDQGVSIDNLMMTEVDQNETQTVEVISTPTPESEVSAVEVIDSPEITEEPDLLAEVTEEPDLLAEATEEPDLLAEATEEPDLLAEATEEPVVSVAEEPVEPVYVVTNMITDDFEGDLSAWNTTASIVEVADGNHVLLLSTDGQLAPISSTTSSGIVVAGQANILSDVDTAGSFTLTINDVYAVEISTTDITISENGEIVTAVESVQPINTWFAFFIEATPDGITISINEADVADYAGALALDGNFVVTTNTSTMFENISVDALNVEAIDEPLATATPDSDIEEILSKVGGNAQTMLNAYLDGGNEAITVFLSSTSAEQDEEGRILVDILVADNYDGATIAQLVEGAGGVPSNVYTQSLEAYVDVDVIMVIAGNEGVRFIRNINRAVSTGPVGVATNGIDPTWTEAYNLLSIEEWHLAGVTGQDVKVGVLDIGFNGADDAGQLNGNLPCLASTIPLYSINGLGSSTHGTEVIEVICDIAPDADVYMFRANSTASVQAAISEARNPSNRMDVLIMALDLGVNTSAGGGISGSVDANVYAEIEAAKNSGMIVIAAAGNNNKRMLVLEITDTNTTTINIDDVSVGDEIKFGWNDFDDNGDSIVTITANLDSQGNVNSSDPVVNPLSVTAASSGTLDLSISATSVDETIYLQVQVVPASPPSSVEFDYTPTSSLVVGANATNITDDTNVGNLGRPADSDHVISVGAICARTDINATRWEFSSNGPRFASDGSPLSGWDATITQDEAKPTVMSYSFVTTNGSGPAFPEGPDPVNGLLSCTNGFGGTSASAAHVAGMTALLMSNDANTSFDALNEANATSVNTFNAIRDYLQARSVDLPLGADADGFDVEFGAGLSILGAPTYDLSETVNLTTPADLLPSTCNGNIYYVGQANMDNGALNGSINNPFTSIAAALNATTPTCIIVMPGEYVTPLLVENDYSGNPLLVTGYNDVSRISTGDVIFWLRGLYFDDEGGFQYRSHTLNATPVTYPRHAGLYFGVGADSVEFSGFTFVVARFYTPLDGSGQPDENFTSSPQAVVMSGSTDTTVSNSQFGRVSLNGVDYPGWNFSDATPILVVSGTEGGLIKNNIFNDNVAQSEKAYPTVAVIDSGTKAKPITLFGNEISGNEMLGNANTFNWGAILYGEGSELDIINNAIHDNLGETIIRVVTTPPHKTVTGIDPTHDRRVRIVGNVFLNNATQQSGTDTAGSMINAHFTPMMYFINNTVINNTINPTGNADFRALISRGNNGQTGTLSNGGSNPAGWEFWEIHNNLIYGNDYSYVVWDTSKATLGSVECPRIPNIDGDSDLDAFTYAVEDPGFAYGALPSPGDVDTFRERGLQNNWIVGNTVNDGGICQVALNDADNFNITDTDGQPVDTYSIDDFVSPMSRDGDFQGIDKDTTDDLTPEYTVSDWQYYAIVDTYTDPVPGAPNLNEYSDGVDAGNNHWLKAYSNVTGTNPFTGTDRYLDGSYNLTLSGFMSKDIIDTARILDVNNWEIDHTLIPPQGISNVSGTETVKVDIGAFEYSPLQFETQSGIEHYDADQNIIVNGITIDAVTDNLLEDSDFITFDLSTVVTGGFGNVSFSILQHPNNYGTQCGSQFENTKGLVDQGVGFDEFYEYCPPLNFYTSITNTAPDYVSFQITVTDDAGATANGEIRFTIDPIDDADLLGTAVIGTDSTSGDVFEVVTTLGSTPSVRLRPYTRYDNFFFSENDNPDLVTSGQKMVDYPFSYIITSIIEGIPADPILVGASIYHNSTDLPIDLGEDPIIALDMSDNDTGTAVITYSVTDARGNISTGNKLIIRSVSVIPDEGLHDDTSFIWNYSDAADALFYSQRSGSNASDTPDSGNWQAERALGAINDTLHTTSTVAGDTASFRFIGTGFNVFMRGVSGSSNTFEINVFDDIDSDSPINYEVDVTSVKNWVTGTSAVNELTVALDVDSLTCTTLADVDTIDQNLLLNNLDEYTITCNGLPARTHTVQIVNTGGGTLSVDAFSIINDGDLVFDDAEPIPPGFHDIDNVVLRHAFDTDWNEVFDKDYSNGIALSALVVPNSISFTITRASGFAIGTTYRNDGDLPFSICVTNETDNSYTDEICNEVNTDIDLDVDGIRIPFFGLDPTKDYTVTLKDMKQSMIFDDLVVFSGLMLPLANLPLGETNYSDLDLTLGEPFGDDWNESSGKQVVNSDRSAIGPFIAFQMDDEIDQIGITADNAVTGPACTPSKKVTCPPPPPGGFNGLAVCVNRGNVADTAGTNFGNCIIIDTYDKADADSNTFDYVDATGSVQTGAGFISNPDGMIVIPESIFDAGWGDLTNNTVEIFSLYPDTNVEFTSVTLYDSASGLGEGSYTANSPGISFVEYDHSADTYTATSIGDGVFDPFDITECTAFKKGNCTNLVVVGSTISSTGIGNAILFKTTGTGVIPRFTESAGTFARVCIQDAASIIETDPAAIATEIQDEVQANGGCQILDLTGSAFNSPRYINGISNAIQHVMIELLPSPTDAIPTLYFDGVDITGGDLDALNILTTGQRYETSYARRVDDNQFIYTGSWQTLADTSGTHSAATYDETDADAGSSITFKTTAGNVVNIIRDLKTSTSEVCTGKKKNQVCTPGVNGYSDITVCVAPTGNTANRNCAVHSSDGNATQSVLPISLNTNFQTGDYVVSITSSSDGFAIDAVEVFDTTASKMTAGIYQENSNLIFYENGQTELLKNTSFENNTTLLDAGSGQNWDWGIDGISATILTNRPFIGTQSIRIDGNTNDSIESETVDIIQGISYTAVARVYVISGTAEMRSDVTGFEAQSNKYTGKWELLHYSFVASANETVQLEFAAAVDNTTFFVDDVHIYRGGAWGIGSGGLNDGQVVTSSGYGSQATFMFTGTGFTVKLASDDSSGETRICYDNGTKHCFTYDDEQLPPPPPVCTGKKKNQVCIAQSATVNNGHTVVGLTSDDYLVTIQQMDNGLRTNAGPLICGKSCVAGDPPNIPISSPTTVKLDYIQIYDDAQPPVLSAGIYNEDALISSNPSMQLFPESEWGQIVNATGYTNNSYYQVNDSQTAGSLLALKVDNTEAATIVVDINQTNANADQLLACGNDVDGSVEFNGTDYDITSGNCALTDQATSQTQVVFNKNNLAPLSGTGGETIFSLQSLTIDQVMIDGYQVIYGTTLTDGYYEETIGYGTSDSILTVSAGDWNSINDTSYSGLNALQTAVNDATIDFTFEGTGVSFLMQTPNGVPNGDVSVVISNASICGGPCTLAVDTTNIPAVDGAITIAGLPKETYTVTLTANIVELNSEQVILDAIEIFGDLQELGSLYDDAQVNVSGTPLLTFGPLWTATENDTTGSFLNNTNHTSSQIGASVSFVVSGTTATEAIVIYDGNPTTSSTNVEVCWTTSLFVQTCETKNLNDASATTLVTAPSPDNYSVSITNQVNEPLVIDAIQVREVGLMTEGIYEETFSQFDEAAADVANDDAGNGFAIQVTVAKPVSFTFEGVAFSALILDNSTNTGVPVVGSTDFDVCVYAGVYDVNGCVAPEINENFNNTSNTLSAVAYGGFHNGTGTDNGEWTVAITNNDATNPLLIDRVDILGNHNELEITDGNIYEAGDAQIRYLPFGSWAEQTSFKDGTPLNGDRFETVIPGSIAYFEFNDNFGSGTVGIDYVRQFHDEFTPPDVCISYKKGVCNSWQVQPTDLAFADAKLYFGEVGDPSPANTAVFDNGADPEPANPVDAFQFSSSTEDPNNPSCTNGCWSMVEYQRTSTSDSLTPLDYIRLYDPTSVLTAGIYQETHPNINVSGTEDSTADVNAKAGFYDLISGTSGQSSFYFTFEGTGLSISTFAGANATDIDICIIDYTGGAIPSHTDASTCLRTYENVQTTDGFVTRSLHGLHHGADYMAILKATLDGTTAMGLDQVTIFDEQWFTETDLDDATYLNQLAEGNSYPIDFKTRNTDKLVQFLGDWQTVSEQIFVAYANVRKQRDPIFRTEEGDRALEIGATALFRVSGSNAVTVDIELGAAGSFQICSIPMTSSANFEVDITAGATCQTFNQNGRANVSFVFSNDTTPRVITVELLSDTWMSLYNVALSDVTSGLSAGLYDHSAPGILYDVTLESILNETMEDENVDWDTIGGATVSSRSLPPVVCPKKTVCPPPDPDPYGGTYSRKVISNNGQGVNIGQGIQYVGSGTGLDLDIDTHYTVVAHIYIDPTTSGGVEMHLISGTETISEVDGFDLSTTTRGTWQTIRADFTTGNDYDELIIQLVAIDGQTTFFVDNVTVTTGSQWATAAVPLSPDVCTGKGKKQVCVPGDELFDAYGDSYHQSTTPGASFSFEFVGTGFELGLIGGNPTGDVEVCYSNEVGFANPSCFTYSQDDAAQPISTICTKFKKGNCTATAPSINNTLSIAGRGIVGLSNDTWTVRVREVDDGYNLNIPNEARYVGVEACSKFKNGNCTATSVGKAFANAAIGLDYLYIYENTNIITVPEGSYNEDAQDISDNDYLATYPEASWQSFNGISAFSNGTYVSPTNDSLASTTPGSVALLQIDVEANDPTAAVVFQLGGDSSGLAQTLMVCVDETNGQMEWDGTQFSLSDSNNCKLFNDVGAFGQVSITDDDVAILGSVTGTHNITITALTSGFFRIDNYQVFDSRALATGLHSESLPATILNFGPSDLNTASTCDPFNEWCFNKTKTVLQDVCVSFKKGNCRATELQPVEITPYVGSAAATSMSGATANFVAQGTGFSIITDVQDNGLDFRVCYKLESAGTSFPAVDSLLDPVPSPPTEESFALSGIDGSGLPILISEGGVLCENLTTDTNNWDAIMDRPQSTGEQYGFSFYGLPYAAYEVQVTVTTPQNEITSDDWFTFDAINVFSDISAVAALQQGLTDDADPDISYEPSVFWQSNVTSNTYENTDSTTDHAGAISQFNVDGNTLVLYQSIGDMSSEVQICLLISNENIHCTVEAERQSRLAHQVTSFTQQGGMVTEIVCISFKRGKCTATGPQLVQESVTFTPIVFYGLGENTTHTVIMENRVQGQMFNIDALRVID